MTAWGRVTSPGELVPVAVAVLPRQQRHAVSAVPRVCQQCHVSACQQCHVSVNSFACCQQCHVSVNSATCLSLVLSL